MLGLALIVACVSHLLHNLEGDGSSLECSSWPVCPKLWASHHQQNQLQVDAPSDQQLPKASQRHPFSEATHSRWWMLTQRLMVPPPNPSTFKWSSPVMSPRSIRPTVIRAVPLRLTGSLGDPSGTLPLRQQHNSPVLHLGL